MNNEKEEALSALKSLADLLGVKLDNSNLAIAGPNNTAKVRMYDGSLEARMIPTNNGDLIVESPRSPGIRITLVDHNTNPLAPKEAIYEINAYKKVSDNATEALNGDIYTVYIGPQGLILDAAGRERAAELPKIKR